MTREWQKLRKKVDEIKNGLRDRNDDAPTMLHGLVYSDLPESDKHTRRLAREGLIVIIAGTDTLSNTLGSIMYRLLSHPGQLKILKEELARAIPDAANLPTCLQIEHLPFLVSFVSLPKGSYQFLTIEKTAVIREGVRLHPGSTFRMERVSPDEDLVYKSAEGKAHVIPAGVRPFRPHHNL